MALYMGCFLEFGDRAGKYKIKPHVQLWRCVLPASPWIMVFACQEPLSSAEYPDLVCWSCWVGRRSSGLLVWKLAFNFCRWVWLIAAG
ncbi:hypothetical protein U1Q18_010511, partial [Sarracenia purpurea var. burkii]